MKKRKLEMLLEQVKGFERPDVSREQYATPATVAAELLYFAFMNKDLDGSVIDLGCGTGMLAIGTSLLQQDAGVIQKIIGIDSDISALVTARDNARSLGASVEWICCDIRDACGHFRHGSHESPLWSARKRERQTLFGQGPGIRVRDILDTQRWFSEFYRELYQGQRHHHGRDNVKIPDPSHVQVPQERDCVHRR
jgi:Predicted RNA methylase